MSDLRRIDRRADTLIGKINDFEIMLHEAGLGHYASNIAEAVQHIWKVKDEIQMRRSR